jgi:hypothetical protein
VGKPTSVKANSDALKNYEDVNASRKQYFSVGGNLSNPDGECTAVSVERVGRVGRVIQTSFFLLLAIPLPSGKVPLVRLIRILTATRPHWSNFWLLASSLLASIPPGLAASPLATGLLKAVVTGLKGTPPSLAESQPGKETFHKDLERPMDSPFC